ncbi:MAG: hypothetical protein IBX64_04795 [Actinobacteria bacterium]|nr:hypothetical protein [Actinomycetota bacterium]
MNVQALRSEVQRPSAARTWAIIFLIAGLLVILAYFTIGLFRASTAGAYWAQPKAVRDAAQPGSALLGSLRFLQSTNAWLEPFKFTGLALIISGIAISFGVAILGALRQRLRITGEALQEFMGKGGT